METSPDIQKDGPQLSDPLPDKILDGVSVVLPAFNEESAIEETILRFQETIKSIGFRASEIIVVDDGSTDKTGERAEKAGARVVRHPGNGGYGRSLKDGINAARHETIVISDADGTYPVEKLPSLLAEFARGFNLVIGERTGAHYRESWLKMPMRLILKWLVEFTAGTPVPDTNSGFRVFYRGEMVPYFNHLCDTFSFSTSMSLAYLLTGKYLAYVPIDYHKRLGKSKVRLFRDSLRTLQYIVQAILYYNPMKIFLILCGFCLLMSLIGFSAGLCFGVAAGYSIGIFSIVCCVIVFCLGLLAEQLRQILIK